MSKKVKTLLIIITVLIVCYITAAHFVIQIALVPSFMEKLEVFETFTEKGYSEQVYTDDILGEMEANKSETQEWFDEIEKYRYQLDSGDGYKLISAVFLRPEEENSHKWALVLHGYTGWKEEMFPIACKFSREGYNVLVPDMLSQGESEGDYIGMGYTDRLDNVLWLKAILKIDPDAEIVLYGQSMGASAVIHLCAELTENEPDVRAHVAAAAADSAFCEPIKMFTSKVRDWTGLPCFGLVDTAAVLFKLEGGYSLYDAKAIDAVPKTDIPMLFIQGLEDKIVSPDNVYRLYDACTSPKSLLTVEGAGHCQSYEKDPDLYFQSLFDFSDGYLTAK